MTDYGAAAGPGSAAGWAMLAEAARRPDTRELVVVHRFLDRELTRLAAVVASTPPATPSHTPGRATALTDFFDLLAGMVDRHHSGTDDLLWPLVADRVGGDLGRARRAAGEHRRLAELLARGRSGFAAWRRHGTLASRDSLADVLTSVATTASEQLADTERDLVPLVEAHLTVAEWERFVDREQAGVPRDRLPTLLGGLLRDVDSADRVAVLSRLPLTSRLRWYAYWQFGGGGRRAGGRLDGPAGTGLTWA